MARRIALFSDVHGNKPALQSVRADIASAGIEELYCLGDLVGYGPDPGGVVDLIREADIPTVRGNYDDGVGNRRGECGCYYSTDQARTDGAASYAFTEAALSSEQLSWLASLASDLRLEFRGARVLLAHGSPRKINEYLLPDRDDAQLIRLADQADADLVCVGHIHVPYHRAMSSADGRRIHYISTGSAGKPKDGDPRGAWIELVLGTPQEVESMTPNDDAIGPVGHADVWAGINVHRVPYAVEEVAQAMRDAGLPETLVRALVEGR